MFDHVLIMPLAVLFVGEQRAVSTSDYGEHMMGSVFSTQVPGLLCGFYSKITIPESNQI